MSAFQPLNCTEEEFQYIINKPILTHQDIRKVGTYKGESDEFIDYDTILKVNRKIIRNNDIKGWDILTDSEYYYGNQPDFGDCLIEAIKYGNFDTFSHILKAYATYTKGYYSDPINVTELREYAQINQDLYVREAVERLISILPSDELDEEFAEDHKSQIKHILDVVDLDMNMNIKEPDNFYY